MKSKFLAGAAGCRSQVRTPFRRTARRAAAALAAGSLLLAGAGVVHADLIKHEDTVATVAKVMPLNVGGPDGTTTLVVVEQNDDGKNGCNLTGDKTLTVSLASSNTAVATVSPSSVTFGACGDKKTLTVTPVSAGDANISATQTSNTTNGSFNLAPAAFTVKVAPPANTAPTLTISGTTPGASYKKGSVPATVCNVTDAEDGSKSPAPTLSPITGDYAADGIGSQTATCSYTDAGGLTVTSAVTYSIIDATPPVITYTVNPADPDGLNGWYKSPVTLTWDVSEPESPLSMTRTGCENVTVNSDQNAQNYTCSAASAGGSATPVTVSLKKDAVAPGVEYTDVATGTLGSNGWYTSNVTATFTATDATSGPASATGTTVSEGEGAAVKVDSPAFSDLAGNTAAAGTASKNFSIDKTPPTVGFSSPVTTGYFGSIAAAPTCSATDNVSGVASCTITGYGTAVGKHTLTATATDMAGNSASAQQSYEVLSWTAKGFYQPVDMNNVVNTVKAGSTVPVKFEVFAGTTEITDPSKIIPSVKAIQCAPNALADEIELLAAGSTSLRYDTTSGQFIYNWKTPTSAGGCYQLTMTAADGTATSALFKLR